MPNDQRGTPFKKNLADLWDAIKGKPRTDGRNWILAVGHESKNVLVEAVREHPAKTVSLCLILLFIVAEWGWSGDFL